MADAGDKSRLPVLVYPVVSGLILAAAFPPLPLGFLAYVGLIPLLLSAERLQGRAAFGAGFLNGVVFYGATVYWIAWITPPGTAGAIFYLSLIQGLLVWVLSIAMRRLGAFGLWSAPFLWVGFEYFLTLGDLGFPWMALAYSQTRYLALIQYAEVTGIHGIACWILLVNLTVLTVLRFPKSRRIVVAVLVLLFVGPASHGYWVLSKGPEQGTVPVAIVQPDINPEAKENWGFDYNFGILKPLTLQAAQDVGLVIWPEASVPAYFKSRYHQAYQSRVQGLVDSLGVYLYTGASRLEEEPVKKFYNSSFLFAPGKSELPYYDKVKLVPFGERAPFPKVLAFLREIKWSGGGFQSGNFDSGEVYTVFETGALKFGGLICFDSVFPWLARELVLNGAEALVVITNDGWFGRTSGPYQHAEIAVLRAIEMRRDVVRAANTGISMFIDAYGRRSQMSGIFHSAVLKGMVTPRKRMTFYAQFGDVFAQMCVVLALMAMMVSWIRTPGDPVPTEAMVAVEQGEGALEEVEEGMVDDGKPMPFLEHLEEFRWHILKALGAVVVGAIFCGIFSNEILSVLTRPVRQMEHPPLLQVLKPMGMFIVKLEIALVGGAILAVPFLIFQFWQFVAPGLFANERQFVTFVITSSSVCFVVGAILAYGVVVPLAMSFFVGLTADTGVQAQFDIGFYISFVLRLLVAFGLVFELPVITFFLAKVGLVTADRMKAGRRYAIVVGFVLAAILTPPDPISQLLMALPLVVLYEISIWVARIVNRS